VSPALATEWVAKINASAQAASKTIACQGLLMNVQNGPNLVRARLTKKNAASRTRLPRLTSLPRWRADLTATTTNGRPTAMEAAH
jgi:hypothetical protein